MTNSIPSLTNVDSPMVTDKNNSEINYFLAGPQQEAEKKESAKHTQ